MNYKLKNVKIKFIIQNKNFNYHKTTKILKLLIYVKKLKNESDREENQFVEIKQFIF